MLAQCCTSSGADALYAASRNAALAIGIHDHKGTLEQGKDADIVLFDQDMNAQTVFIGGELKYQKGSDSQ